MRVSSHVEQIQTLAQVGSATELMDVQRGALVWVTVMRVVFSGILEADSRITWEFSDNCLF